MRTRIVAALLAILGLLGVGLVSAAPAAADYCRTLTDRDRIEVEGFQYKYVYARLYTCDRGSYENFRTVRFTWPDGTTWIRKLFDSGPNVNIQKRCGSSGTWYTIKNYSNYYNGTTYGLYTNCTEPARFRVQLRADVKYWPDSTVYHYIAS